MLRPGDVDTALKEIAAIGAAVSADPAWKPQITGERLSAPGIPLSVPPGSPPMAE